MQLEKAKETQQDMERCRLLAQRIAEELAPESAAVLGDDEATCTALQKALRKAGVRANEWTAAAAQQPDLLVVEDPTFVELPAQLAAKVLLVCTDTTALANWAEQLAQRGYYRDMFWRSTGRPARRSGRGQGLRAGTGHPAGPDGAGRTELRRTGRPH